MLKILLFLFVMVLASQQCGIVFGQDLHGKAIVLIVADGSRTGIGSVIKVDKETRTVYILTAHHVIEGFEEVQVKFYAGGTTVGQAIGSTAKVNPQWTDEHEGRDFAVIYVRDYPENLPLQVVYIDDFSEEKVLDKVLTFGHEKFGDLVSAPGDIIALGENVLTYASSIGAKGFSGGPVFNQEGFMIGMNLELGKIGDMLAVRANVFKSMVDDWVVGLPRMELVISIDSPAGAKDGSVSTGQEFYLKASAKEAEAGNVVTPKAKATLKNVPEGYEIVEGQETMTVLLDKEIRWKLRAPDERRPGDSIAFDATPEAKPPLEPIGITVMEAAELSREITEPKSRKLTVYESQGLDVKAVVRNIGDATLKESGSLEIDFKPFDFDLSKGEIEQPFVVGNPVEWKLKAREATSSTRIDAVIILPGMDENDMTAKIIKPSDSISVKIKPSEDEIFIGLSCLFSEDVYGGFGLGVKKMLYNILRKGIPLYCVLEGRFGFDALLYGIDQAQAEEKVSLVFAQKHTLGTFSLGVKLGDVILEAGGGRSFFFGREDFSAWHVESGLGLDFGAFAIRAGVRNIFDEHEYEDDGFPDLGGLRYLIQMRLGK